MCPGGPSPRLPTRTGSARRWTTRGDGKETAMDGARFDRIAKHVARGVTRRQALKIGVGGAVAGTLGQLGRGQAMAGKGKPCTEDCGCPDNQKCANNRCTKACPYS